MSSGKDIKTSFEYKKWSQYDIIARIVSDHLEDQGHKFSMARMADYLGVHASKIQKWKNGQWPSYDDLQILAQKLGLSCEWLLLGIGNPLRKHEQKNFNPDYVEIGDTLHDLLLSLKDPLEIVATIGGLRIEELTECMSSRALPPLSAISKWIHHYKLNANFILAQIGRPVLTDEEYKKSGPLDWLRKKRNDLDRHLNQDDENIELMFINGVKPPEGPSAAKEMIYMINELMLNNIELKRGRAADIETATIIIQQEKKDLAEKVENLQARLMKASDKVLELQDRLVIAQGQAAANELNEQAQGPQTDAADQTGASGAEGQ